MKGNSARGQDSTESCELYVKSWMKGKIQRATVIISFKKNHDKLKVPAILGSDDLISEYLMNKSVFWRKQSGLKHALGMRWNM